VCGIATPSNYNERTNTGEDGRDIAYSGGGQAGYVDADEDAK
jgi:hypothetical protein